MVVVTQAFVLQNFVEHLPMVYVVFVQEGLLAFGRENKKRS